MPLLRGVGLIAGALNAVAGGGSFLTLSFLIVFDLPASVGKWHQSSGSASSKPYRLRWISTLGKQWKDWPVPGPSDHSGKPLWERESRWGWAAMPLKGFCPS
jgi:hypothetical protein